MRPLPRMVSADPRPSRIRLGQGRRSRASTSLPAGSTPSSRRAQSSACAPARPRSAPPLRLWGSAFGRSRPGLSDERHVRLDAPPGADLARQPYADQRRVLRQRAEQELEQRPREALEGDCGSDRIAGDADHRRPRNQAERDRVRRPQGDAVDDELAVSLRARRRCGRARPRDEPGDHEHEVGAAGARRAARRRSARHRPGAAARRSHDGPALACERLQHRAVGIRDLARRKHASRRAQLVARRQDRDGRAPRHAAASAWPATGCQRDVVARDEATGREQQHRPSLHVLAGGANVRRPLPTRPARRAGRSRSRSAISTWADGVESIRDRLARCRSGGTLPGASTPFPVVGGDDRVAVHRGAAMRRVGRQATQRRGEHATAAPRRAATRSAGSGALQPASASAASQAS